MDTLLLGVLGTSFSALVASLGYFFKLLRDRRRTTRLVLYYLLELHHRLCAVVYLTDRFPAGYLAEVTRSLGKKGLTLTDSDLAEMEEALRTTLRSWTTKNLDDLGREVVAPYEAALLELAKDDPVLAFMLKGRESLSGPKTILNSLMEPVPSNFDSSIRSDFLARLEVTAWKEMLTDMERVVKIVALRCSYLTRLRVERTIESHKKLRRESASSAEISRLVDEIVQQAIAAGRNTISDSSEVIPEIGIPPSLKASP